LSVEGALLHHETPKRNTETAIFSYYVFFKYRNSSFYDEYFLSLLSAMARTTRYWRAKTRHSLPGHLNISNRKEEKKLAKNPFKVDI